MAATPRLEGQKEEMRLPKPRARDGPEEAGTMAGFRWEPEPRERDSSCQKCHPLRREREKHADFPFLLLSTLPPEPPVAQTQLEARWQGTWQPEPRGSGALNTEPAETGRGKELRSQAPRTSTLARQYHLRSLRQHSRKYRYTKRKRLKNHDFIPFFFFFGLIST